MRRVFSLIRTYLKDTDLSLWFFFLAASLYGCLAIAGVSNSFSLTMRNLLMQVAAISGGVLSAVVLSRIKYEDLAKWWKFHLPATIFFTLLTFVIGVGREGADDRAWIPLPMNIGTIQPSEFLKISFILSFAYHLSQVKNNLNSLRNVIFLCLHAAVPVLLVHFQGDDGTATVFVFIFLAMLFVAGISWKYIAAAVPCVSIGALILWTRVMSYDQQMRVLVLFFPGIDEKGIEYQQNLGLTAIGSGQIWGTGLLTGSHQYIPEIQNDFIFAFIGQALGFMGCLTVILLLTVICALILRNAAKAKDELGRFICIGVFAMIISQSVINIGMCLKLLPVIGITLPFFSSGGSSALSLYLALGLILSVRMHRRTSLFLDD